ncbi:MAG TPA: hypothetical protein VJU83_10265 [Burkholderiales bacterium]|nr:hypothetical protein [Burkholderiales bacterium]
MRLLVLILFLANLALWSYREYLVPQMKIDAAAQQVNPEKMRLLKSEEGVEPLSENAGCIVFGPLDETKLSEAKERARSLQAGLAMSERKTEAGTYLELREPTDEVRKQLSDLLPGIDAGNCAG